MKLANVYRCQHFCIEELVPPIVLKALGEELCWVLLNILGADLLLALDWLRDQYGGMTINNYKWVKNPLKSRKWSGLRVPSWKSYNPFSMHAGLKGGLAFDIIFRSMTAEQVRQDIKLLSTSGGYVPSGIKRIEEGVSWLHVDGSDKVYPNKDRYFGHIYFFRP